MIFFIRNWTRVLAYLFLLFFLSICSPLFPQEAGPGDFAGTASSETMEEAWEEDLLLMEGEGLTITASPETSQQMETISREEIQRRAPRDIGELLQEALALGITRYGGYGNTADINIRGFDSERVAFLIDGIPVNSVLAGDFELSQIDPASVESVEVIYGGSDTKYNVSGAFGGVVNIITIKKQPPGLKLGASVSNLSALPGTYRERNGSTGDPHWEDLFDAQNVSLSAAWGAEKYSLSGGLFANRAMNHFLYRNEDFNQTWRKDHNEVWDTGLRLSLIRDLPGGYNKFIAGGDLYYGDKNIPRSGTSSLYGKQKDFVTRQNLMLDMPRAFHDSLAMEASLTHSWQRLDFTSPADLHSLHDEQRITAINRWAWFGAENLTLRAGGDYRYIHMDSTDIGIRFRHDGGLYLTAEYQAHKKFLVIPSIKGVFSGPGAEIPGAAIPKLGLLWKAADFLTIKNNYFRNFKYPDSEDLYWSGEGGVGNPDLKPEDGWGADLGIYLQFREFLTLETSVFGQWIEDSIHWFAAANNVWTPQNVGEAAFFGGDAKLRINFPLSGLPLEKIGLSLSYQYLLSYLLSYGYTWASDKRIPYMPTHTLGASLDIPWKTGALIISAHYETLRYGDRGNLNKLDPCFLLNMNVNQRIHKLVSVFMALRNMLNASYESFDDYPMPGLTLTLGMRLTVENER